VRVPVREHAETQAMRMHLADGLGYPLGRRRANPRLGEGPIEPDIDLGDPRDRGETVLVVRTVDAEGADVVERALLEAEKVLAVNELAVLRVLSDVRDGRLVKSRRRRLDHIHAGDELLIFLRSDLARNENPQVPDAVVQRVDDRLTVGDDLVDTVVEVENPVQGLLWGGDVVAPGAEDDDRRLDVSEINPDAVRCADLPGRQSVADKQIVDDPLHFTGVEQDRAAPP